MRNIKWMFLLLMASESYAQFDNRAPWDFHDVVQSTLDSMNMNNHKHVDFIAAWWSSPFHKLKKVFSYSFLNDSTIVLNEKNIRYSQIPKLIKRKDGVYLQYDTSGKIMGKALLKMTIRDSTGYKIITEEKKVAERTNMDNWKFRKRIYNSGGQLIEEKQCMELSDAKTLQTCGIYKYQYFDDSLRIIQYFADESKPQMTSEKKISTRIVQSQERKVLTRIESERSFHYSDNVTISTEDKKITETIFFNKMHEPIRVLIDVSSNVGAADGKHSTVSKTKASLKILYN
jgi:hypothetical protein